ncbi:XRE family transcriptional regulator [Streptomyces sp. WAC 05379]|uniref:helix-turn-helix domain-containing protein n=1 Tax=Streptomyces sp. WAC 05379 TaxID=2203207 RepID=UPI000F741A98|nr:helix-turn-helix transcriptional regulator [Streptomyces sp. WAC 05379]RSO05766.1 XRE family transcriptional regulator [Streptomyces sp. WAC 05379]
MNKHLDTGLHRRRLRIALRQAREERGMTQLEAAQELNWSLSKINRIEQGTFGTSVTDLRAMLALYDISDPVRTAELEEAARGSKGQVWWSEYRDLMDGRLETYLSYEQAADELRAYHPVLIPRLLQTREYAQALHAPRSGRERGQRLAELLMARQEIVLERSEIRLFFVVDEAALRRQIGSREVMRTQLHYLTEASRLPQVDVSVLPFTAGAHLATTTGFVLFGFSGDDDDLVYIEGSAARARDDEREQLYQYQECFEDLTQRALRGAHALDAITAAAHSIVD